MNKTIHAVFENGVFRPVESVDLPEKSEVEFEPRLVTKKDEWPEGFFQQTAGASKDKSLLKCGQNSAPFFVTRRSVTITDRSASIRATIRVTRLASV